MRQLRILLLLFFALNGYSQVDINLDSAPNNSTALRSKLNDPLYNNANKIVPFTMVVVSILFILGAFQIYNKMHLGETNVMGMITRWILGIVMFLALMTFLNMFIKNQDFNRTSPQFQMDKL